MRQDAEMQYYKWMGFRAALSSVKLYFKVRNSGKNKKGDIWRGQAVAKWLRLCVTRRKVAGSTPDEENESFRPH
jgi:hypothetical protein